jgi:metal-sulfur cluster biosynthetic enzyme
MNLKDKIVAELGRVTDPGTGMDVVSIGLVKEVSVTPENGVRLKLRPSSPVCPLAFHLALEIKERVKKLPEVQELEIAVMDYQRADELNKLLRD